jgi:hypothetical protein
MIIRIGVEGARRPILDRCRSLASPILVSANSLWNDKRKAFRSFTPYAGFDCALDSGGFVAMKRYGGFRWTAEQYAELASRMKPTWWAQMDFCCEPEIAKDKTAVFTRITKTADHLMDCRSAAVKLGATMPMPVLQGWRPSDYCQGPAYQWPAHEWPALVGVGSVCRRSVNGPDGIISVVDAIDRAAPKHVKLHLFGIKGSAIEKLVEQFPHRCASMDSMAYNMQARWDTFHSGKPRNRHYDAEVMATWYQRQVKHATPSQLSLLK